MQILETPTKTKMGKSGTDRGMWLRQSPLSLSQGLPRETIVCALFDAELSLKHLAHLSDRKFGHFCLTG